MKSKKQIRAIRRWCRVTGAPYRQCKRLWHSIPHNKRKTAREEMEAVR